MSVEGGVFRVNHRTGEMSVVLRFSREQVVCTPARDRDQIRCGR